MNVYIELLLKIISFLETIEDEKAKDLIEEIYAVINQKIPVLYWAGVFLLKVMLFHENCITI